MLGDVPIGHGPDTAIPVGEPIGARLWALFQKHRRRLATLVLVLFLALVALTIFDAIPHETRVRLPLGDDRVHVTEVRVEYVYEGRAIHELVVRYEPGDAPEAIRHSVDLSPGDYDVRVELLDEDGGHRVLRGHLTAPADGEVRVHLSPLQRESP